MYISCQNKWTISILALTFLVVASTVNADTKKQNAADIYRKALNLYQYDDEVFKSIRGYAKGEKEPDEKLRKHIKANSEIIKMAVQASLLDHCDWNFEYLDLWFENNEDDDEKSKDYSDVLREVRRLIDLLIADARILANQDNIESALERCMASYRVSRHVDSRTFIGFLVRAAYEIETCEAMMDILSENRFTPEMLKSLKEDLVINFQSRNYFIDSFDYETQRYIEFLDKMDDNETKAYILEDMIGYDEPTSLDDIWFKGEYVNSGSQYFSSHSKLLRDIIQKPYQQAFPEIINLLKKTEIDSLSYDKSTKKKIINCGSFLMSIDWGSITAIYTIHIKNSACRNALLCAVNLYSIEAETGRLPTKLPESSPKDTMTDEDFRYKITSDGFLLKCGEINLRDNKVVQWQFKIPGK